MRRSLGARFIDDVGERGIDRRPRRGGVDRERDVAAVASLIPRRERVHVDSERLRVELGRRSGRAPVRGFNEVGLVYSAVKPSR